MSLIRLLICTSKGTVVLAILAGLIAGFSSAGLIALINTALAEARSPAAGLAWVFAGLSLLMVVAQVVSDLRLTRLGQESILTLRLELSRRICAAPLRQLQTFGPSCLLAALTEDVTAISNGLLWIPSLCINGAIVAGGLIYLGWLSPLLLVILLGWMAMGILAYRLLQRRALQALKEARDQADALYHQFRALIQGIKELKLHRPRREAFCRNRLEATARTYRRHFVTGQGHYTVADCVGTLLFYLAIGLFLFVIPRFQEIPSLIVTGYALVLLYLMAPLEGILNALPPLGRTKIALGKIEALGLSLEMDAPEERRGEAGIGPSWKHLELVGVTHSYFHEKDDHGFLLGPVDLSFHPGEVAFLIGGNGSGKTTLALLLAGLYVPEAGEIRLDGRPITDENREEYRQLFSVVFSDCFLFEDLLGLGQPGLDARAQEYLIQLQLNRKVQVRNGAFSTLDLSQGQRKRLALLAACLEDRPFYLFDEWAADQDPLFKRIFYTQLLPELKGRGKTVLVITHDDEYFYMADRCIKLEDGKLRQEWRCDTKSPGEHLADVKIGSKTACMN